MLWKNNKTRAVTTICRKMMQEVKHNNMNIEYTYGLACFVIPSLIWQAVNGIGSYLTMIIYNDIISIAE